jgi:hypothetical protein
MCLESYEKEIDNIYYKSYQHRLCSFKNWKGKVKPSLLASSGFYYLSQDDICRCFYCGVEIYKWMYNDCPITEHYKYNKNCDLIECLNNLVKIKETNQQDDCRFTQKLVLYFFILYFAIQILILFF